MASRASWRLTHLAGQVPLGFGCQERQGVETQLKPFCLLVFPAALVQFLRGLREERSSSCERARLDSGTTSLDGKTRITSFPETLYPEYDQAFLLLP